MTALATASAKQKISQKNLFRGYGPTSTNVGPVGPQLVGQGLQIAIAGPLLQLRPTQLCMRAHWYNCGPTHIPPSVLALCQAAARANRAQLCQPSDLIQDKSLYKLFSQKSAFSTIRHFHSIFRPSIASQTYISCTNL